MYVTFSALREALLSTLHTILNPANTVAPWQVHAHASFSPQPAVSPASHLSAVLSFTGALAGTLTLSLPQAAATTLLGQALPNHAEAWLALARSLGDHLCATLSSAPSATITLEGCALSTADQPLDTLCAFELTSFTAEASVALLVFADKALLARLEAQHPTATRSLTSSAAPLHRVIDVPLAVTLRFGQRHLTLREVLDLNPGSLLELDRHVEEPVDLILGERIIARGEVVIIDGNYGMRVTEVVELPPHTLGAGAPLVYANA